MTTPRRYVKHGKPEAAPEAVEPPPVAVIIPEYHSL
jgi:hypothetical protein